MSRHRWDPVAPRPRGLVRPVPVDPSGAEGPTRAQAAGSRWRQTSRGLYVPAATPTEVPEQRIIEQAARLPRGGAVTGWAACRLAGAGLIDGLAADRRTTLPVPLALGVRGRIRADRQVLLVYDALAPGDVAQRHGIPSTRVLRATFDAVRLAEDDREAVVVLDMMAAARLVSLRRMAAYVSLRAGSTGVAANRAALSHASEHSRSPNETRLRLIWERDARLPVVHVNCPVHDRTGRLLGIADLLDEEAGLVVEFDGADHRRARRHTDDVRREDAFRRHRLELTRETGLYLRDRHLVVARLRAARGRALFQPVAERTWVARPVEDWLDDHLTAQEQLAEHYESVLAQPVEDVRGW